MPAERRLRLMLIKLQRLCWNCNGVISCLLKNEPASNHPFFSLNPPSGWRRRETESEQGEQKESVVDPKPSDLSMSRVSPDENRGEARTRIRYNWLG